MKDGYKIITTKEGDEIFSFVGPLGKPSEIDKYGTVVIVGGGTGIASANSNPA